LSAIDVLRFASFARAQEKLPHGERNGRSGEGQYGFVKSSDAFSCSINEQLSLFQVHIIATLW
jgi:hypothetical protein